LRYLFAVSRHGVVQDTALLILRVVVGVAFATHGMVKIQNPFGWMGENAFAPGIFQALAALSEFGGGIAWALGLLTPLAGLGILSTMTVAIYTQAMLRGAPFVSPTGGSAWELAGAYFSVALILITMGPGRFSADRALFGAR
jgi:putative oxidoreductase